MTTYPPLLGWVVARRNIRDKPPGRYDAISLEIAPISFPLSFSRAKVHRGWADRMATTPGEGSNGAAVSMYP